MVAGGGVGVGGFMSVSEGCGGPEEEEGNLGRRRGSQERLSFL